MNRLLLTPYFTLLTLLVGSVGCDREQQPQPPEMKSAIEATPAYRPLPAGSSFRATIAISSRIPQEPTKRQRKKLGQFRSIEEVTTIESTFYVELLEDRGQREKWRLDFESFEKTTTRSGSNTATTTHDLPDRALIVEASPESILVTDKDGESVTRSQRDIATSVVNGLRNRDRWGEFFSKREFPQGKLVEAPAGQVLDGFAEAFFGEVLESNTTVSLFRLGIEAGSEVAHFDVHSRTSRTGEDGRRRTYLDFEQESRLMLRIVDGLIVSYDTAAKVTPRDAEGKMLREGSGRWEMRFAIDVDTLRVAD